MAQRWRAIINHAYRFRTSLANWAAVRSMLFRNKLHIRFVAAVCRKFNILMHSKLAFKVEMVLRLKQKTRVVSAIAIGVVSRVRSIRYIECINRLGVGIKALVKKKSHRQVLSVFGIGFTTVFLSKRKNTLKRKLFVGFSAHSHRKGKLYFTNRRATEHTVSLLKKLTIGEIKKRSVGVIKRDQRIIPQFRIDFGARLQKGSEV